MRTRAMVMSVVLMAMRARRAMESRLLKARRDLIGRALWRECTSGQSEDYPSHWGGLYTVTVFVLLWLNGLCELRSMVCAQGLFNVCKHVQSISQRISEHQSALRSSAASM